MSGGHMAGRPRSPCATDPLLSWALCRSRARRAPTACKYNLLFGHQVALAGPVNEKRKSKENQRQRQGERGMTVGRNRK